MSEGAAISYVPFEGKAIGAQRTPGKSNTCWKALAEKDEEPRYEPEVTRMVYDDCGVNQVENFHLTFIYFEKNTWVENIIYKLIPRTLSCTSWTTHKSLIMCSSVRIRRKCKKKSQTPYINMQSRIMER